jgi:hypothetical protein
MSDSVVEEVHEARRMLWEKAGSDWNTLLAYLRTQEAEHPQKLMTREQFQRDHGSKTERVGAA